MFDTDAIARSVGYATRADLVAMEARLYRAMLVQAGPSSAP